ncbi:MAG: hypothetical protein IPO03_05210 [Bacteroidetes bacterium]|nr:hypothetical protein [Bacteroidota bacterium]
MREPVEFRYNLSRVEKQFDRRNIRLGQKIFATFNENAELTDVSLIPTEGFEECCMSWITPKFEVDLTRKYSVNERDIERLVSILNPLLSKDTIIEKMSIAASKIRIEHIYKSEEFEKSIVNKVLTVANRIEFVELIKSEQIYRQIPQFYEPVIIYHLLTCFDIIGSAPDWLTFDSWLRAVNKQEERRHGESLIQGVSFIEDVKLIHQHYLSIYGVRNSFYRFIDEILNEELRSKLLQSIRIEKFIINDGYRSVLESDESKKTFLFGLRNSYTHSGQILPIGTPEWLLPASYKGLMSRRLQKISQTLIIEYSVQNWPQVLMTTVKSGLAQYILDLQ